MNLAKTDHAVSPVIATILLVAIAVVLAAIILAVTMGFSGDPNEKKIGLNAKAASGPNATLLLYGGDSIPELVELQMIDQDSPYGSYVEVWNKSSGAPNVGIPYEADYVAQPAEDLAVYDTKINVKGIFSDGKESILLVQPMTFHDVNASDKVPSVPIVFPPKVSHIGPSSGFAETEYKGMTSEPTNWVIYSTCLEDRTGTYSAQNMTHQGNTSGIMSGRMTDLDYPDPWSSGKYAVWAEITTPTDGTIVSEKTVFHTANTTFGTPYLTTEDGKPVIRADYQNRPAGCSFDMRYRIVSTGINASTTATSEHVDEYDPIGGYYPEGYVYLDQKMSLKEPIDFWVCYRCGLYGPKDGPMVTFGLPEPLGDPALSAPYQVSQSGSKLTINVDYKNISSISSKTLSLHYREKGAGQWKSAPFAMKQVGEIDINGNSSKGYFTADTLGAFTPGKTYQFYADIEMVESPIGEISIVKPLLYAGPGGYFIGQTDTTVSFRFYYKNIDPAPSMNDFETGFMTSSFKGGGWSSASAWTDAYVQKKLTTLSDNSGYIDWIVTKSISGKPFLGETSSTDTTYPRYHRLFPSVRNVNGDIIEGSEYTYVTIDKNLHFTVISKPQT